MARDRGAPAKAPGQKKPLNPRKILSVLFSLLFGGLVVAYLCLTFIPQPDKTVLAEFHLTEHDYYNLVNPLEAVLVVIWLVGFYGALKIKSYASMVSGSKDGRALGILSGGLLLLILSQPFVSALSALFGILERHHPSSVKPMTIVINYVALALAGAAFILIARGARLLYGLVERRQPHFPQTAWVLPAIFASGIYSYFVVIQPIHNSLARRIYFLSDWLLVITIAAPYICFWYFGLYGAYYTALYGRDVRGSLYKSALGYVAGGIFAVVASSIAARVIVSLSTNLTNMRVTPLLVILYGLLALEAIGFILIAVGAGKLKRIEAA